MHVQCPDHVPLARPAGGEPRARAFYRRKLGIEAARHTAGAAPYPDDPLAGIAGLFTEDLFGNRREALAQRPCSERPS